MSEWSGWSGVGDTPQTVMTTRAPAVLITRLPSSSEYYRATTNDHKTKDI